MIQGDKHMTYPGLGTHERVSPDNLRAFGADCYRSLESPPWPVVTVCLGETT
ncbi:hypothetical protein AG1IA_00003 [Rhizoctonia solani AG-1 IA]|uniref:Uncharacterized protein n=1 Tax=Thanatephorus cucumeris (strain AG1-IA) TaxID=983506 RepID=L8X6M6_THACA|nr:hypothetical protein AG1IA_00003 [Rhizoctonia solani AG-1 IA]